MDTSAWYTRKKSNNGLSIRTRTVVWEVVQLALLRGSVRFRAVTHDHTLQDASAPQGLFCGPPSSYEAYLCRVGRSTWPSTDSPPDSARIKVVDQSSSRPDSSTGTAFRAFSPLPRPFSKYDGPPAEDKAQHTSSAPPRLRMPLPRQVHWPPVTLVLARAGCSANSRYEHHFGAITFPSGTYRLYPESRQCGEYAVHYADVLCNVTSLWITSALVWNSGCCRCQSGSQAVSH